MMNTFFSGNQVDLDEDLVPAFDYAVGLFVKHGFRSEELRLGGGTALATLWKHRHSTDIDFAVNGNVFDEYRRDNNAYAIRDDLRNDRSQGIALSQIAVTRHMIGFRYQGVPVSMVRSRLDGLNAFSEKFVGCSGVRLAKTEAIFTGKCIGRILKKRKTEDRDGYDIAFALTNHPEVLRPVLSGIDPISSEKLLEIVEGVKGRIGMGRPILVPCDAEMAKDPWGVVADKIPQFLRLDQKSDEGR
ncbi:MAG: nucleotidyl transferase AbiEii/AbiGii toxin family protein [Gammaproteobacteria bacterium]|nr:nucleotidyl transferase AbiEii/AbiGii toxin family protein [Gammaproteobacteria bacterium]